MIFQDLAPIGLLTRALALELSAHGIRVNDVAPGAVETLLTGSRLQDPAISRWILERMPLKKIGTPEDVAHAVCFLASEQSALITGSTIVCDGGYIIQIKMDRSIG